MESFETGKCLIIHKKKGENRLNIIITNLLKSSKEENGITLITLVITIAILLILSGITINQIFGEDGLIQQLEISKGTAEELVTEDQAASSILSQQYANAMAEDSVIPEPGISETPEAPETPAIMGVDGLEIGDYVNYEDGAGSTRKCRVLYDSSYKNGVEIIPLVAYTQTDWVILGHEFYGDGIYSLDYYAYKQGETTYANSRVGEAVRSYNNAIAILNDKAEDLKNSTYSDRARSLGSVPENPSYESTELYQPSVITAYNRNREFKDADENYITDIEQMYEHGVVLESDSTYWLASRRITQSTLYDILSIRILPTYRFDIDNMDSVHNRARLLHSGHNANNTTAYSTRYFICPVFHLRYNVKVMSGSGTQEDPYTLGL